MLIYSFPFSEILETFAIIVLEPNTSGLIKASLISFSQVFTW